MTTEAPKQKSTAVATVPESAGGPLSFESLVLDHFSTLPAAEKARTIKYMQGAVTPLQDMIGKKISVEHIVAHRVELVNDKTGEISEQVRIVLVSPKGEAWQAVSDGVKKSLRLIAQFEGVPPWPGGLTLEVSQIKTRRGFRTFVLSPSV